ncbi:adenylate/guanylate cyclase domain-containing protein [Caenimonas soli]|uniref:adenylate/guanylate cyclase domain-containing protein n=1 Tax=Caenimonas soli TaxID=2735555 RepID=UPI001F299679|nr:adenylate/guanylate cyclase domain-containing protein [Caenimonas soli]
MTSPTADPLFTMPRHTKVLMVMDVVESVRLMEQDEDDFIRRWQDLVTQAEHRLLPLGGGRLVKSLGDGLMLEFADPLECLKTAFALQDLARQDNQNRPGEQHMYLRVGAHLAEFVVDRHDIYGPDVNLTARVTTLAGPGEIVVTAELRDHLTAGLDADIEDLGDCHLKHVNEPVHVYRVGPAGHAPVASLAGAAAEVLRPTLIVVPFTARTAEPGNEVLGEILAEEIIAGLSQCAQISVLSRLSTTALRHRQSELPQLRGLIDAGSSASYALTGAYRVLGDHVSLMVELADLRSGHVAWAASLKSTVPAILAGEDEITSQVVSQASTAVARVETERTTSKPLPTLQSATLQMSSITLMHRASRNEFQRVHDMLEHLIERHPRIAAPRAWLAKWHVLQVTRGLAPSDERTTRRALELTRRALDADPNCSLAMAVEGFVKCHLTKDLDGASACYARALQCNPNDSLAWLFSGVLHAFRDAGAAALESSERALALSPLDPMLYFYQSLAASAALTAGRNARAVELATHSLRANASHPSTLRVLTIAQTLQGDLQAAGQSADRLLKLEPAFSVGGFLKRSPGARSASAQTFADALRRAGVPE